MIGTCDGSEAPTRPFSRAMWRGDVGVEHGVWFLTVTELPDTEPLGAFNR